MNNTKELQDEDLILVSGGAGKSPDNGIDGRVISIVAEQFGIPSSNVDLDAKLVGDLGANSLDIVDLSQTLSEEFKIVIDDVSFSLLVKVRDVIQYIKDRVNV